MEPMVLLWEHSASTVHQPLTTLSKPSYDSSTSAYDSSTDSYPVSIASYKYNPNNYHPEQHQQKKKRKLRQEKTFTGVVDHVKRRYCFVSSDEITDDIKIKSRDMKNAINGDKVLFKLLKCLSVIRIVFLIE